MYKGTEQKPEAGVRISTSDIWLSAEESRTLMEQNVLDPSALDQAAEKYYMV
jgi:hypothetical protein